MGTSHWRVAGLIAVFAMGCFSEPGRSPANNDTRDMSNSDALVAPDGGAPCEPAAEVCDGEDNDCNGEVDEGFDIGTDCTVGLGVCAAAGQMVCNESFDGVVCDATEGAADTEELCGDRLDNDCDGAIDEGFADLGDACTSGLGMCATAGVMACAADGVGTVCDAVVPPPSEAVELSCDGLDNDCDGMDDEGCDDDADDVCDAAMTLVSPGGDALCPGGGGDCDDTDAAVHPGAPGLCDGKDNDCADGIDDIKRVRTRSFTVQDYAAVDLENSPIQAIASDIGFCFHMTGRNAGGRSVTRGVYNSAAAAVSTQVNVTLIENRVADIAWSGARCGSLVVEEDGDAILDARAYWWTPGFAGDANNRVVSDGILHIVPSWDATLTFARGQWVVGYSTSSGSAASYTTIRENFNSTDTAAPSNTAGLNGTFPEFGVHPGSFDLLFASNFFNINVHQLDVGDLAGAVPAMQIASSSSRSHLVMNTVDGETWFALRNAAMVNAWEIRRVSTVPDYALSGQVPYATAVEPQDFLSRNVFVGGPDGRVWFLDGVDEKLVSIADDGAGGLDVIDVPDPTAVGQMLTGRQASATVTEILWLTDAGAPTRDATFEVADYSCF